MEGAIGGAVTALVFTLLFSWMYAEGVTEILGVPVEVNYLRIALLSPVLTASSILGDLSASVLKRQYGVKDYGSIMRDTAESWTGLTAYCLCCRLCSCCQYTCR